MVLNFSISVIIPVYNAERFIEKAIRSALEQPEVTEIIVVNDGSTDGTQAIVEQLKQQHGIVKLYQHPNGINKGRSASRNLAIEKAEGNYIAFLDADDYYLPNRFSNDFKILQSNENCDGVYNAVGFHFYRAATRLELQTFQLYTVTEVVAPEDLFEKLLYGRCGHFQIDGFTVKRTVFEKTGNFNEALVVGEDTELFWKMAIKCRLYTGIIQQPVAVRGVHDTNIFDDANLYKTYTIKIFEYLTVWGYQEKIDFDIIDAIFKWIWILREKQKNFLWMDIKYWAHLFFPHPKLLLTVLSIKYFPVIRFRQTLFPFLFKR